MIAGYLSGAEGELISDYATINIVEMKQRPLKNSGFRCRHQANQSAIFSPRAFAGGLTDYRLLGGGSILGPRYPRAGIQQTIDQWARLLTGAFDDAIAKIGYPLGLRKLEESRGLMRNQQNGITLPHWRR